MVMDDSTRALKARGVQESGGRRPTQKKPPGQATDWPEIWADRGWGTGGEGERKSRAEKQGYVSRGISCGTPAMISVPNAKGVHQERRESQKKLEGMWHTHKRRRVVRGRQLKEKSAPNMAEKNREWEKTDLKKVPKRGSRLKSSFSTRSTTRGGGAGVWVHAGRQPGKF